jgi:hypothetical protein
MHLVHCVGSPAGIAQWSVGLQQGVLPQPNWVVSKQLTHFCPKQLRPAQQSFVELHPTALAARQVLPSPTGPSDVASVAPSGS